MRWHDGPPLFDICPRAVLFAFSGRVHLGISHTYSDSTLMQLRIASMAHSRCAQDQLARYFVYPDIWVIREGILN